MTGAPPGADPGAQAIFEQELKLVEEDSVQNESELLPLTGAGGFPSSKNS